MARCICMSKPRVSLRSRTGANSRITEHLRSADVPSQYRAEFDRMIEFIDRGASMDGQILRMKIEDLDFKRKQNLRDFLPELANAIDY